MVLYKCFRRFLQRFIGSLRPKKGVKKMYRAGKVSVRVPELAELRRIEAEVKDARHAGAKRVEVKFPEEKVLLRKLDGKKFQEAVKRIFSARELAELRKLERQMEKMRHHHLRAEVSFPEVHPVPRRVNELLYDAPRKFFGKDEVRQLKLLEKEAMLLHREVSHIGGVKVQLVRPVAREVEEGLLRARPDLLVNEESELKVLATELALARHQERGRVIGSGPTSNMFLRPLPQPKPPLWMLHPQGIFQGILELEAKLAEGEYADAVEAYLALNRLLQQEAVLSPVEKMEAFNRLLADYRAIRDVFFKP